MLRTRLALSGSCSVFMPIGINGFTVCATILEAERRLRKPLPSRRPAGWTMSERMRILFSEPSKKKC